MSYDPSNIFAQILRGEIACTKVFENEHAFAFNDIHPQAPFHILVIPKGEYRSFHDFHQHASTEQICGFYQAVQHIIQHSKLDDNGYRIITNCGKDAGQIVDHYHVHILSGNHLGPLVAKSSEF